MMKSTFLLSIFFAAAIVIVSCEYDREEEELVIVEPIDTATTTVDTTATTDTTTTDTTTTDTTTTGTTPPAVTYDNTVKAIMTANCTTTGCHAAGNQVPDLTTYSNVNAQSGRVKVRAVDLQNMPPGGGSMTNADRDILKNWIADGAKEK